MREQLTKKDIVRILNNHLQIRINKISEATKNVYNKDYISGCNNELQALIILINQIEKEIGGNK